MEFMTLGGENETCITITVLLMCLREFMTLGGENETCITITVLLICLKEGKCVGLASLYQHII